MSTMESPASRVFIQAFIQAPIKENIKTPRHWTLWPMNSSHKGPVSREMFPFDDDIMLFVDCNKQPKLYGMILGTETIFLCCISLELRPLWYKINV